MAEALHLSQGQALSASHGHPTKQEQDDRAGQASLLLSEGWQAEADLGDQEAQAARSIHHQVGLVGDLGALAAADA